MLENCIYLASRVEASGSILLYKLDPKSDRNLSKIGPNFDQKRSKIGPNLVQNRSWAVLGGRFEKIAKNGSGALIILSLLGAKLGGLGGQDGASEGQVGEMWGQDGAS